jgi:hypothetical protein
MTERRLGNEGEFSVVNHDDSDPIEPTSPSDPFLLEPCQRLNAVLFLSLVIILGAALWPKNSYGRWQHHRLRDKQSPLLMKPRFSTMRHCRKRR